MWHMNHFSPTWPEEIVHVYKMLVKETRSESAPEQTKLLMGKRGGGSIAVELSKKLKLLFRQVSLSPNKKISQLIQTRFCLFLN